MNSSLFSRPANSVLALASVTTVALPVWRQWLPLGSSGAYLNLFITACLLAATVLSCRYVGNAIRTTIAAILVVRVVLVSGVTAWLVAFTLPIAREMAESMQGARKPPGSPQHYVVTDDFLRATLEGGVEILLLLVAVSLVASFRLTPKNSAVLSHG